MTWSFDEYAKEERKNPWKTVDVLAPRFAVTVFSHGFRPEFHPSSVVSDRL